MTPDAPNRRRLTIGLLMAVIALLAIPIFLAVPVIRLGGFPHHMTVIQTARWLAIERDNACIRCHGGSARRVAFDLPDDADGIKEARSLAQNLGFTDSGSARSR